MLIETFTLHEASFLLKGVIFCSTICFSSTGLTPATYHVLVHDNRQERCSTAVLFCIFPIFQDVRAQTKQQRATNTATHRRKSRENKSCKQQVFTVFEQGQHHRRREATNQHGSKIPKHHRDYSSSVRTYDQQKENQFAMISYNQSSELKPPKLHRHQGSSVSHVTSDSNSINLFWYDTARSSRTAVHGELKADVHDPARH